MRKILIGLILEFFSYKRLLEQMGVVYLSPLSCVFALPGSGTLKDTSTSLNPYYFLAGSMLLAGK